MLLDFFEDVHVHVADHIDGQTPFAKATRAADPVQICLVVWVTIFVHWQVKVDDHRNLLHIDPFSVRKKKDEHKQLHGSMLDELALSSYHEHKHW